MKNRNILFILLLCITVKVSSQDGYTLKKDSIQSDVLKQNRKIIIFLPEGYDAKEAKFPVLYVLDADGRDQHTVPTARFLSVNNKMPKAIVVGVFNIDRNHDFLPDSSQYASTGGGADNFVQFFKKELIPYINKNFKTELTLNSPKCKERIEINKACTLKVKSVVSNYKNIPTVTRIFAPGEYMNGLESVENIKPGLKYSYYEGVWDSVPDFSKLTPKKIGATENLDFNFALKKDSFGAQFEGYLHITKKDMYDLWVVSDDGSKIYLNNQLLFENDGLHSADNPVVKVVPLNPGYYPIRIDYFERTGSEAVTLGYVTGGKKLQALPIPKEMLFYKE